MPGRQAVSPHQANTVDWSVLGAEQPAVPVAVFQPDARLARYRITQRPGPGSGTMLQVTQPGRTVTSAWPASASVERVRRGRQADLG